MLNFCSNDYLGLAGDNELKNAFIIAAEKYGVGSGASQYVCGYTQVHKKLERTISDLTGYPSALCFSSGYMANLAILSTMLGRGDHVFIDRLAHASIYDAAVLSRASLHRYQHADTNMLDKQLCKYKGQGQRRLVITDGVFSMDGDIAPLQQLANITKSRGSRLYVDDAHGFGVVGEKGLGSLEACGLEKSQVDLYMATFAKACGVYGAFVVGHQEIVEYLTQLARPLIYTTALPPPVAAAADKGINKALREGWRRQKVRTLIDHFKTGARTLSLPILNSQTPIQAIMLYDDKVAIKASQILYEKGILVSAICPPTVPKGSARLRVTLTSNHTKEQVNCLLEKLAFVNEKIS